MCFSIPYKILKINKSTALIEGDKVVKLGKEIRAKTGDYLQVSGGVAVSKMNKSEGDKLRKLILQINKPYEDKS